MPEGLPTVLRGIFDGFEGYRTTSDNAMQHALESGLVVVDTNVLLNLYRYDDAAREDLFKVLEALGDRLFVPHQVMLEFWRNREGVLRDRSNTAQSTVDRLNEVAAQAEHALREWANRLAVPEDLRAEMLNCLSDSFDLVIGKVEASAGDAEDAEVRDTAEDPVLKKLEPVLRNRVGASLTEDEHSTAVAEGLRRVDERVPPGFKDKDKEGDLAAGDYLLWKQALDEAKRRSCTLLTLVTGDTTGDDWWRRERGELRGPRLELYAEAKEAAGAELVMLRPQSLVYHAQKALNLEIGPQTLATIERADDAIGGASRREAWSEIAVSEFLDRLQREAPVQYDAIIEAAQNGGVVDRERVYELGGYETDRTLRGFTRPTRRIMQNMQDTGTLAFDVPEPLETVYDPTFSYVIASGFRIPADLVAIIRRSAEADAAE